MVRTESDAEVPQPAGQRPRAARGEGQLLREQILDAAEQLLVVNGQPDGVSMRAIAAEVGVTPAAIYLHFVDKDGLFFHVASRRFRELRDVVLSAASSGTPAQKIESIMRGFIAFGVRRRDQYLAMYRVPLPELTTDELNALPSSQLIRTVSTILAEAVELGEFRDDIDPDVSAGTIWAAVHGTILVIIQRSDFPGDPMDVDELAAATVRTVIAGLRA